MSEPLDLTEARRVAEGVTPGEWFAWTACGDISSADEDSMIMESLKTYTNDEGHCRATEQGDADRRFCIYAHNNWDNLLTELEGCAHTRLAELEAENARLKASRAAGDGIFEQLVSVSDHVGAECGDDPDIDEDTLAAAVIRKITQLEADAARWDCVLRHGRDELNLFLASIPEYKDRVWTMPEEDLIAAIDAASDTLDQDQNKEEKTK